MLGVAPSNAQALRCVQIIQAPSATRELIPSFGVLELCAKIYPIIHQTPYQLAEVQFVVTRHDEGWSTSAALQRGTILGDDLGVWEFSRSA
jgi:hypothetical protein